MKKTCPKCGEIKSIDEFAFKYKDRDIRQWCCRTCNAEYKLSWYARNRDKHRHTCGQCATRLRTTIARAQARVQGIYDAKHNPRLLEDIALYAADAG